MFNVDKDELYVATYKEIFVIFTSFCIILFLLYPKDMLEKNVLKETTNYDLSILYLQNMLKQDPTNENLMFKLAQKSIQAGKRDLALRLLQILYNSNIYKKEAYKLSYLITKQDYFDTKKITIKQKLSKLLNTIITKNLYKKNEKELLKYYKETIFLKQINNGIKLSKELLKYSYKYNEQLAQLYILQKKEKKASNVYLTLFKNSNNINYLKKAINTLIGAKYYKEAIHLAQSYEDKYFNNISFRNYLLKIYLGAGELQKANNLAKKILRTM